MLGMKSVWWSRFMFVTTFCFVLACQTLPEAIEGGLYSLPTNDGRFTVVKVLKVDEAGFHLRMYSNVFPSPPNNLDESACILPE
jgi:hypothetical protein